MWLSNLFFPKPYPNCSPVLVISEIGAAFAYGVMFPCGHGDDVGFVRHLSAPVEMLGFKYSRRAASPTAWKSQRMSIICSWYPP